MGCLYNEFIYYFTRFLLAFATVVSPAELACDWAGHLHRLSELIKQYSCYMCITKLYRIGNPSKFACFVINPIFSVPTIFPSSYVFTETG